MSTFRGKPLCELTAEDLCDVPISLLVGMLKFHYYHNGARNLVDQRKLVVAEARKRKFEHWILNNFDPPRCDCGGPGLYIVGKVTYCRKCKPKAIEHLKKAVTNLRELRSKHIDEELNDIDKKLRRKKSLKNSARRINGKKC